MPGIELLRAQRDELDCIENLMQFYLYDFSEWLPLTFAERGLFNVQLPPDYWRKPATQPFLIRVDGALAGFVTVDATAHLAGVTFNISYLFVSRRYRGQGVGRHVVDALLQQLPGCWQVFHLDANLAAKTFWAKVIPALGASELSQHRLPVDGYPCTLFKFRIP